MLIKLVDAAKMFNNAKTTAADAAALLAHCKKHKKPDFGRLAEAVEAKDKALIKALGEGSIAKGALRVALPTAQCACPSGLNTPTISSPTFPRH